jgi:aldehyde:ferredoxin oxidoreductase
MRYLSVFISKQPTKPIVVVDLNKPERISVIDAIYYCDFHGGHAYISNYKNIFTAKFDRRADTGEIKLYDIPKRIEEEELLALLEELLTRGKDKQPRRMHPNSLANLRPESPRLLRRLQTLRRWSHEQEIKSFFTRGPRTRCSLSARA